MTIVPALLSLLGDRAWSLPGRLDRVLPEVDIEGARLPAPSTAPRDVGTAAVDHANGAVGGTS